MWTQKSGHDVGGPRKYFFVKHLFGKWCPDIRGHGCCRAKKGRPGGGTTGWTIGFRGSPSSFWESLGPILLIPLLYAVGFFFIFLLICWNNRKNTIYRHFWSLQKIHGTLRWLFHKGPTHLLPVAHSWKKWYLSFCWSVIIHRPKITKENCGSVSQ